MRGNKTKKISWRKKSEKKVCKKGRMEKAEEKMTREENNSSWRVWNKLRKNK